jgi:hypothetical protein
VTAFVTETGRHGTLLVDDPNRLRKVMALRIERPSAIPNVHEMVIMMTEDEIREIALGVKREFTGVIEILPDKTRVLVLERVENLRWGHHCATRCERLIGIETQRLLRVQTFVSRSGR